MLRDRTLERHHLLPSSEPVAVVAGDLGDVQLLARLHQLLPDPPSRLDGAAARVAADGLLQGAAVEEDPLAVVVHEHGVELPVGAEHGEPGLRRRAVVLPLQPAVPDLGVLRPRAAPRRGLDPGVSGAPAAWLSRKREHEAIVPGGGGAWRGWPGEHGA